MKLWVLAPDLIKRTEGENTIRARKQATNRVVLLGVKNALQVILGLFTLLLINGRDIRSTVCKTPEHGTAGLLALAASSFLGVGTARQVHHERALSYHGPAAAGYGLVGWLVGSGTAGWHVCTDRDCHWKSITYRPAWLATPAGLVKNPVKSMVWRKWCARKGTYLWES